MQSRSALVPCAVGAVLATLTAGSVLGAVNLFHIQFRLEGVASELVRLHASFQLNGLMGAFVCGVALQALPRFWGGPPPPRALAAGLPALLLVALLAQAGAAFGWPAGVPLSGALLVGAGAAFATWVAYSRYVSPRTVTGLDVLLVFGAFAWPAGNALWLAGQWPAEPLVELGVKAGQDLLVSGFLLAWILGMAPRVTPFFTELGHPRARAGWVLAALLASGVLVRLIGFVWLESLAVAQAGQLITAAALLFFVARMDRPGAKHLPIAGTTGAFRGAVLAALGWCALGSLLFALSAVRALAGWSSLSYLALDAARHALAVGFAFGLLIAVSTRLVPTFTGRALRHPRAIDRGLVLFHLGVALRLTQALAPLGLLSILRISGLSGILVLVGILPWAYNVLQLARDA